MYFHYICSVGCELVLEIHHTFYYRQNEGPTSLNKLPRQIDAIKMMGERLTNWKHEIWTKGEKANTPDHKAKKRVALQLQQSNMNFWQMAKVMSNYRISGLPWSPLCALHTGRTGDVFIELSIWNIAFMDGMTICKFLIRRILQRWLMKYSKGCLQMQSNATVSMFSHLWMARASAYSALPLTFG